MTEKNHSPSVHQLKYACHPRSCRLAEYSLEGFASQTYSFLASQYAFEQVSIFGVVQYVNAQTPLLWCTLTSLNITSILGTPQSATEAASCARNNYRAEP